MTPNGYPQVPFRQHVKSMAPVAGKGWQQGEHVLISGPTSAGKTTLASKILPVRSHVVMLVTKLQDPTFEREFKDWTRYTSWPRGGPPSYERRILLWPKPEKTLAASIAVQRDVMLNAFDAFARQGRRCVCIDEMLYMTDPKYLGLSREVGMLHYTGRSSGLSMVTLTQRPAWIPKVIYSSISHAFIARTKDKDDVKRLSDLGGIDAKDVAMNLESLPDRHDYVYVNPQGDAPGAILNTRR